MSLLWALPYKIQYKVAQSAKLPGLYFIAPMVIEDQKDAPQSTNLLLLLVIPSSQKPSGETLRRPTIFNSPAKNSKISV